MDPHQGVCSSIPAALRFAKTIRHTARARGLFIGLIHTRALSPLLAIADASLALDRLDRALGDAHDLSALSRQFAYKEAVCAVKVGRPRLVLSDAVLCALSQGESRPGSDVGAVAAYLAALDHARQLPGHSLRSPASLRQIQALIVANDGPTGGGRSDVTDRWHPSALDVESPIVRTAIAVAEIGVARPLAAGNCRLMRILTLALLAPDFPRQAAVLHPSLYLTRHADRVRELLGGPSPLPEPWIAFFAGAIASSARAAHATIRRLDRLARADIGRIGTRYAAVSALKIHDALRRHPVASMDDLLEMTGLRVQSATRAIHRLRALRIVREIRGRPRSRVFGYVEYVRILGEGTEVL
jgi:hypothetical protein